MAPIFDSGRLPRIPLVLFSLLLFLMLISDFVLAISVAPSAIKSAEHYQHEGQQLRLKRDLQSGVLLSRYGRAAVLSRYGKRSGGNIGAAPGGNRLESAGPWLLCQRTGDGQFLRCRPFRMMER